MKFDVASHLGAVQRSVSSLEVDGKPARAVTLGRSFHTTVEDLWDALTSAERLPRWFMPVTGDLEPGGRYQLEGNAGGTITTCEPPKHLKLTWEFAKDISWVDVWVSAHKGTQARLELTHTAHLSDHWAQYGPGAVGVGWELGLLGLALHMSHPNEPKLDENELAASDEGKGFTTGSSQGWGQAAIEAGENAEVALASARRTTAFYTGVPEENL